MDSFIRELSAGAFVPGLSFLFLRYEVAPDVLAECGVGIFAGGQGLD